MWWNWIMSSPILDWRYEFKLIALFTFLRKRIKQILSSEYSLYLIHCTRVIDYDKQAIVHPVLPARGLCCLTNAPDIIIFIAKIRWQYIWPPWQLDKVYRSTQMFIAWSYDKSCRPWPSCTHSTPTSNIIRYQHPIVVYATGSKWKSTTVPTVNILKHRHNYSTWRCWFSIWMWYQ